jgi:hypothetical protein
MAEHSSSGGEEIMDTDTAVNSSSAAGNFTTATMPLDVQFSGMGDYDQGSYKYDVLLFIAVMGILGNVLVLIVLCKNRSSAIKNPSMASSATSSVGMTGSGGSVVETLLINQSVADLLTAFFLLLASHVEVPGTFDAITWQNEFICRLFRTQMPLAICFSSSVYNLVAIALEQYLQIVHPVFHHTRLRRIPAKLFVVAVWLVGISFNAALTLPTSGITVMIDNTNSENDNIQIYTCSEYDRDLDPTTLKVVGVFTGIVYYFLPVTIIVYAFCHIVARLQRKRYQVGPLGQMSVFRSVKVAVLKSMALFCCVFIVCWSLNSFVHTLILFWRVQWRLFRFSLVHILHCHVLRVLRYQPSTVRCQISQVQGHSEKPVSVWS